jgi:hypothetical protein
VIMYLQATVLGRKLVRPKGKTKLASAGTDLRRGTSRGKDHRNRKLQRRQGYLQGYIARARVQALDASIFLEALLREGLFCVRYRFTDITPKRKKPGMCGLRVPNMPG